MAGSVQKTHTPQSSHSPSKRPPSHLRTHPALSRCHSSSATSSSGTGSGSYASLVSSSILPTKPTNPAFVPLASTTNRVPLPLRALVVYSITCYAVAPLFVRLWGFVFPCLALSRPPFLPSPPPWTTPPPPRFKVSWQTAEQCCCSTTSTRHQHRENICTQPDPFSPLSCSSPLHILFICSQFLLSLLGRPLSCFHPSFWLTRSRTLVIPSLIRITSFAFTT